MVYFFKLPTIINDSWSSMNQNEVFQLELILFIWSLVSASPYKKENDLPQKGLCQIILVYL